MAVTFKAAGTFTAATTSITPPYPTAGSAPVANDIALLVCESENQVISLTTANGFVELGAQANKANGTGGVTGATRLAVFWKRCVGSDAAPVVADSGDHTTGQIFLFSGVRTSGNPWDVFGENVSGATTAHSISSTSPSLSSGMVVAIGSSSNNGTSTTEFSAFTGFSVFTSPYTIQSNNTNTAGLGGGFGVATADFVAPRGDVTDYTAPTFTLANASASGKMSILLAPAQATPTVALNSPPDGTGSLSTTPALQFTGTDANGDSIEYQIEIDTTFGSFSSGTGMGFNLKYIDLKMSKTGSPTDNLFIDVQLGAFSIVLGTSGAVAASGLTTVGTKTRFTFSTPVALTGGTFYTFVVRRSGAADLSNYARAHSTNADYYAFGDAYNKLAGAWSTTGGDLAFVLSDESNAVKINQPFDVATITVPIQGNTGGSTEAAGQSFTVNLALQNATSSVDTALFVNTGTPADTHPFNSGEAITYTPTSALAASTTYYWRVRALDPSGSNIWGLWSATRQFATAAAIPVVPANLPPQIYQPLLAQ